MLCEHALRCHGFYSVNDQKFFHSNLKETIVVIRTCLQRCLAFISCTPPCGTSGKFRNFSEIRGTTLQTAYLWKKDSVCLGVIQAWSWTSWRPADPPPFLSIPHTYTTAENETKLNQDPLARADNCCQCWFLKLERERAIPVLPDSGFHRFLDSLLSQILSKTFTAWKATPCRWQSWHLKLSSSSVVFLSTRKQRFVVISSFLLRGGHCKLACWSRQLASTWSWTATTVRIRQLPASLRSSELCLGSAGRLGCYRVAEFD